MSGLPAFDLVVLDVRSGLVGVVYDVILDSLEDGHEILLHLQNLRMGLATAADLEKRLRYRLHAAELRIQSFDLSDHCLFSYFLAFPYCGTNPIFGVLCFTKR